MRRFRSAERHDLETLVRLLADDALGAQREDPSVPLDPGYVTAFDAILADPNNRILVLEQDEALAGFLQLTIVPSLTYRGRPRAAIEGVRVAAARRGQGLGRALIAEAIAIARRAGCHLVQLTSDKRRPDAIRFYASLGFRDTHEGLKLSLDAP